MTSIGRREIFIAVSIVLILFVAFYCSRKKKVETAAIIEATTCEELATSIEKLIRLSEPGTVVRTWFPSAVATSPINPLDPFCNSTAGRTPVCDTYPLLDLTPYVNRNFYRTYQNIRSSAVWAQGVYSSWKSAGICEGSGVQMTPQAIGNLLPTQVILPAWVMGVQIYIKDVAVSCGKPSDGPSQFDVKFTYNVTDEKTKTAKSCESKLTLTVPQEKTPPQLEAVVTNGKGEIIPSGACTSRLTVDQVQAMGAPGVEYRDVQIQLTTDEAGVVYLINKRSWEAYPTTSHYMPLKGVTIGGASISLNPSFEQPTYNQPPAAKFLMRGLADQDSFEYLYDFLAVDPSGNESRPASVSFRVKTPRCSIPTTEYCKSAQASMTPSSENQGANVRPWDDCLNGVCPEGTRWGQKCDDPLNICYGQFTADDCGQPACGPGVRPGYGCPSINSFCGKPLRAVDDCGYPCGWGINCPECDCSEAEAAGTPCDCVPPATPIPTPSSCLNVCAKSACATEVGCEPVCDGTVAPDGCYCAGVAVSPWGFEKYQCCSGKGEAYSLPRAAKYGSPTSDYCVCQNVETGLPKNWSHQPTEEACVEYCAGFSDEMVLSHRCL